MNSIELRIGNYFEADFGGVHTVQHGSWLETDLVKKGTPIPITDEWLLKFGFEIISDYHPEGKTYELGELRCTEFYNCVSYKNERITRNEIKYVHQLQNLYFALTGKELILNQQDKNDNSDLQNDHTQ